MLDVDTGTMYSCHDQGWVNPGDVVTLTIAQGLMLLRDAEEVIGHNIRKYDLRVIKKLHPDCMPKGSITDTLILAKLIHPDIKREDSDALSSGRFTNATFRVKGKPVFGSHSLGAWGLRLGIPKIDYAGGFETWSPEMQLYGEGDLRTTRALWLYLSPDTYSQQAIELEYEIADICYQIELDGIPFDFNKAVELQAELTSKRDQIKRSLLGLFPDWEVITKEFVAKVGNTKRGIKKGDTVTNKKTVVFNPGSREHISKCLIDKYGWKPTDFTPTGKPQIDDEVLTELEYPEAKQLSEYFIVCKTLSQLAEGKGGWMQSCGPTGLINAAYDTMGTVTSRCSHFSPNIGQVPSVDKPYGVQCRSLFGDGGRDYILLGADMSGLELRCLANYMAHFDGGDYATVVTTGDVHTLNQQAAGLPTRNNAKTFIFGFLYGAGPAKIGSIVGAGARRGKQLIDAFLNKTPALKRLRSAVIGACGKGYVIAIDGRHVPIRKPHAALNSLLQSAGAIICKRWVVGVRRGLEQQGLIYGKDHRFVAFIHDELQILVRPHLSTIVGDCCKATAIRVGDDLKFKCPLAAEYKTGANWADSH